MNPETFEEFKNSFSYGSRTDLSFKFLKMMSDEEAALFFQQLLEKLGQSFDDGQFERLVEHVIDGQVQGYIKPTNFTYDDGPFVPLSKPIHDMRIGLLTSTGHFVEGDDPKPFGVENMSQEEAIDRISDFLKVAPDLAEIPLDTPDEQLRVRHGGYDIRGVQTDRNVAFPLDRMVEFGEEGVVGTAVSPAYSFVGAAAQRRLLSKNAPVWLEQFQKQAIEGIILVPV